MKGKEALERIELLNLSGLFTCDKKGFMLRPLENDIELIKAELDKLDRIKEVVKEVNYIGLYKNGCIKIKQIIEE